MVHADSFLHSYENVARKKENRLTRISLSIVWLFIICHVWKLIPTIYELIYSEVKKFTIFEKITHWFFFQNGLELPNWPSWLVTIKHLSHTLIAFNSAVNFLIYAILWRRRTWIWHFLCTFREDSYCYVNYNFPLFMLSVRYSIFLERLSCLMRYSRRSWGEKVADNDIRHKWNSIFLSTINLFFTMTIRRRNILSVI